MMLVIVGLIKQATDNGFCSITTVFLLFVAGVFIISAFIHPQDMQRSNGTQKGVRPKPASSETSAVCMPCQKKGHRKLCTGYCKTCKQHLCVTCCKSHKQLNGNASHVLVHGNVVPRQASTSVTASKGWSVPCPKHKDKTIESVCHLHKVAVCKECLDTDHKECKTESIPDFANQYVNGIEFLSGKHTVSAAFDFCSQTEAKLKCSDQTFNETCDQAVECIDTFRNEINTILDKWQEHAKKCIEETRSTHTEKMASVGTEISDFKTKMSNLKGQIDNFQSSGQHKRLVAELFQAIGNVDSELASLQKRTEGEFVYSVSFVPNENIRNALEQESLLGTIETSTEAVPHYTEIRQPAQLVKTFNVKHGEDKKTCSIQSIQELHSGKIIVTDSQNSAIKVIDIDKNEIIQRLVFFYAPCDIAIIPELNQAAVTCPMGSRIEFLSTEDEIKVDRTLNLQDNLTCRAIAYAGGKLVIGYYCKTGRCDIMNLEGEILHKCLDVRLGEYINYAAISKDGECVLLSDTKNNRVLKMSWEGVILREYSGCFDETRGFAVRRYGSFYVCSNGTGTVHRVSGDQNTKIDVVLSKEDGIGNPVALCWRRRGELIVACFGNVNYVFK